MSERNLTHYRAGRRSSRALCGAKPEKRLLRKLRRKVTCPECIRIRGRGVA